MQLTAARSQYPGLIGVVLLAGAMIALLPLPVLAVLFGGAFLLLAFYLEPVLALVVTLCVAPLKTLITTETGLPLDVGQMGLVLFFAIWLLRYLIDRSRTLPRFGHPAAGIALFVLAASLSVWTAYTPAIVFKELLKWVQILALVIVIPDVKRPNWLILGLIISGVLQALLGLWEFQGGAGAEYLWILDYRHFRAFGTFGQPNPFGGFMGMVLPLALGASVGWFLRGWGADKPRAALLTGLIYAGQAGILLAGLLASWSRGAWLGFIGASVVMVYFFPLRRQTGALILLAGALMVGVLWLTGTLPASVTQRLTGFSEDFAGIQDVRGAVITDENFAVLERLAHWQSALMMAETSPWAGIGFGNYEAAYPDFDLINWPFALGHAHNYYLNLLAETGIIGLIGYLIMWSLIFLQTGYLLNAAERDWFMRGLLVGLMGTWTHITIHSLIDKLYVNNLFLHVGALLGLLAMLSMHSRERNDDSHCSI